VTQEVESDYAGVLLKITLDRARRRSSDDRVHRKEGEEVAEVAAPHPRRRPQQCLTPFAPARDACRDQGVRHQWQQRGRIKASPLARRIARERGIDLSALSGTPRRPIVAQDVERGEVAKPSAPAAVPTGEIESVPLTNIRKTMRARLTAAWQAPVFQLTVSADMTRANELVCAQPRAEPGRARPRSPTCSRRLRAGTDAPPRRQRCSHETPFEVPDGERSYRVAAPQG